MIQLRMRSMMMAILPLMQVASLAGCGGFPGGGGDSRDYHITVNQQSFTRGNTGEATIRNTSDKTLEYNLCQRRLERQVGRNWVAAFEWPTAGGACTAEARSLAKGASVNTLFELPTGVPSGTYRVVFNGLLGDNGTIVSSDRAASPPFEVR